MIPEQLPKKTSDAEKKVFEKLKKLPMIISLYIP